MANGQGGRSGGGFQPQGGVSLGNLPAAADSYGQRMRFAESRGNPNATRC